MISCRLVGPTLDRRWTSSQVVQYGSDDKLNRRRFGDPQAPNVDRLGHLITTESTMTATSAPANDVLQLLIRTFNLFQWSPWSSLQIARLGNDFAAFLAPKARVPLLGHELSPLETDEDGPKIVSMLELFAA